jgi:hypothetical protein
MEKYRRIVQEKLLTIKEVTARLGIAQRPALEESSQKQSRALAVLSGASDIKGYKKSLVLAKDKRLPALFKEVKDANYNLTKWMNAQTLPMEGMVSGMEGCIGEIKDRIFNVSLYAGLTEQVTQISEGAPAGLTDKLHIFQQLTFMDEECLIDYRHGGMDFKKIRQFDEWLAEPSHRDRILPFPRCVVAFRIRRATKEREWDGSLSSAFINFDLAQLDKLTFLYIRNGENLYRMNCDLELGAHIFPGRSEVDFGRPMMARMSVGDVEELITVDHYNELLQEEKERKKKYREWARKNPKKREWDNPHRHWGRDLDDEYEPFNSSSVYYDDIKEEIEKRIKYYNRIVLIIQGLYDRSEVLHPHPPVRLWEPDGFSAAIELVYADHGLYGGEAPDFERYRAECNAVLKEGCLTIGQDDAWQRREARRLNKLRDSNWRDKGNYRPTHEQPYGDPGPGYIAKIQRWRSRSRSAIYKWVRRRLEYRRRWNSREGPIPCSIAVPATHLFNVMAYKPGDYKQFFNDPRTRAQYLKWAPMLIAAEEYHAGNWDMEIGSLRKRKKKRRSQKA